MQSSPAEVYECPTPPPSPNQRQHLLRESDEETRLDAFLDRSDGFRESFEQPWATTPAIQRTRVSLASHRLCFVAPSVHLPNCRCHCSTKLSADFVGRIPALQRAIVPVARPLAIAYPYLLPLASHEATPQHREALPFCATGNLERVGGKRKKGLQKAYVSTESQWDEEKRKSKMEKYGKVRMSLTLPRTPRYALADRRPIAILYPCCQQATL